MRSLEPRMRALQCGSHCDIEGAGFRFIPSAIASIACAKSAEVSGVEHLRRFVRPHNAPRRRLRVETATRSNVTIAPAGAGCLAQTWGYVAVHSWSCTATRGRDRERP